MTDGERANPLTDNDRLLLEALKENWTHARYHENARWKYIYFYYLAVGGVFILFASTHLKQSYPKDCTELLLSLSINLPSIFNNTELFIIGVISAFLAAVGYASLWHLIYENAEYGNCIRMMQYLSRDLNLSTGIMDIPVNERNDDNGGVSYIALPLGLDIRKRNPDTRMLTAILISALLAIALVNLTTLTNRLINLNETVIIIKYIGVYLFSTIIGIEVFYSIFLFLALVNRYTQDRYNAQEEMNRLDPEGETNLNRDNEETNSVLIRNIIRAYKVFRVINYPVNFVLKKLSLTA